MDCSSKMVKMKPHRGCLFLRHGLIVLLALLTANCCIAEDGSLPTPNEAEEAEEAEEAAETEVEEIREANCDLVSPFLSPAVIYYKHFNNWLETAGPLVQVMVSGFVIAFGGISAWDAPKFWRWLFTLFVACGAYCITGHEVSLWEITSGGSIGVYVLSVQGFLAVGGAVFVGFEGSQVLFGGSMGLLISYSTGAWARWAESVAPGVTLVWYSFGIVAGFLLFTVYRKAALATLGPMLGSLMVVTGSFYLISQGLSLIVGAENLAKAAIFPSASLPWSSVAGTLLGNAGVKALPLHCACALLATALHSALEMRAVTVPVLVVSPVILGLATCTSILCKAWPGNVCPEVLTPVSSWQWPLFGTLLWIGGMATAAWYQLDKLADWERSNFWNSDRILYQPAKFAEEGNMHRASPQALAQRHAVDAESPSDRAGYHELSDTPFAGFVDAVERWWEDLMDDSPQGQRRRNR